MMLKIRVSSQQYTVHKLGESQVSVSPKFRFDGSIHLELSDEEALIPGLPDDIAFQCLLRVPVDTHVRCRAVCKRWFSLFGSRERFFSLRKEFGLNDPWLFVFSYCKCTMRIVWKVLDLVNFSWHGIPAMPCKDKVCPRGFRSVSIPDEGCLFVCGGLVSDVDCPLNLVLKYEACTNRWTVMKKMITARSFFASGVIDDMVYVTGGNSADLFELSSAEVLDTKTGVWRPISSMVTSMTCYDSAVIDGKLFVTEGWSWPFYVVPRGQVYDPRTDRWENMSAGLREGWTGSSVVIDRHLFVVTEHERTKLKVYNSRDDTWDVVEGPALPEQICKPFCVNCWESNIFVVGQNLHVAVGYISRFSSCDDDKKLRFTVRWRMVDAPGGRYDPSSAHVLLA